jgi:hypothetical protein
VRLRTGYNRDPPRAEHLIGARLSPSRRGPFDRGAVEDLSAGAVVTHYLDRETALSVLRIKGEADDGDRMRPPTFWQAFGEQCLPLDKCDAGQWFAS